ncbi:conserved hypothetical protein [Ricinus communis]|uniref:Uncharacterized protein n=1 Tax=Ricinus communis TaxID=3988 RepID=B9SP37_RICCO|nr:conserved hypothetical protein [Ricinus communis]
MGSLGLEVWFKIIWCIAYIPEFPFAQQIMRLGNLELRLSTWFLGNNHLASLANSTSEEAYHIMGLPRVACC